MNHCLIQSVIKSDPQMRYTKDNQTPIAEMQVIIKGLRNDDPSTELKVLGWGNLAKEMIDQLKEGQNIVLEGRLRMNSVTRKDGTKEKQAELTVSRIHNIITHTNNQSDNEINSPVEKSSKRTEGLENSSNGSDGDWNSSPLVPEVDEIPF